EARLHPVRAGRRPWRRRAAAGPRAAPPARGVRVARRRARVRPAPRPRVRGDRAARREPLAAGDGRPRPRDDLARRRPGPLRGAVAGAAHGGRGTYRFVVTANRYRVESAPFRVSPSTALTVRSVGPNKVTLDYPG